MDIMYFNEFVILVLAGLVGGFLGGLLGIGGGIIYVTILPIVFDRWHIATDLQTPLVVINSLFATLAASSAGLVQHIRHKNFYIRPALLLAVFSVPVAFLVLHFVLPSPFYSPRVFGIISIFLLVLMLVRALLLPKNVDKGQPVKAVQTWQWAITGAAAGFIAPISGLGGGVVVIPLLVYVFGVLPKHAGSLSLCAIIAGAAFSVVYNIGITPPVSLPFFQLGNLIVPVALACSSGIVTAPIGVWLAHRLDKKIIHWSFVGVISCLIVYKSYLMVF